MSPADDGLRGFYILKVESTEAAEALAAADHAIQSGHLRFEFHVWLAPPGLQVKVPSDYLDIDIHKKKPESILEARKHNQNEARNRV